MFLFVGKLKIYIAMGPRELGFLVTMTRYIRNDTKTQFGKNLVSFIIPLGDGVGSSG